MFFVLMEVGKKQSYIFKSNRLKHNIGASMIIKNITEDMPYEKLKKYNGVAIINGGGKGLYKFEKEDEAKMFVKEISMHVLENYSGVELYFVTRNIDLPKDDALNKIDELYVSLGKKKAKKEHLVNQVSLGIEKKCSSTGLPAVGYDKDGAVSQECKAKEEYYDKNIENYFAESGVKFSNDLNRFIDDKKSYIAIVHIDGNSMGNKFIKLNNYYKGLNESGGNFNSNYIKALSKLSNDINCAYNNAFKKVIKESVRNGESTIRPVILAGDDVTFISTAKDAIRLTKIFIDEIRKISILIGDEKVGLNASAGIAFVKSKYPFSIAYDRAEELTSNCKRELKMKDVDASMIDWHIIQGDSDKCISEIRKEHYTANGLRLNLRPIYIGKEELNSYDVFKEALEMVKSDNISRSKWKKLRGELVKGDEATKRYLQYYGLDEVLENKLGGYSLKNGIRNNTAVFFDAIEIMDIVEEV